MPKKRSAALRARIALTLSEAVERISAYNKLERDNPQDIGGYPYWNQISLHHDEHLDTNEEDNNG